MCLDNTNGETLAFRDLKVLTHNQIEQNLLHQWKTVLDCALKDTEYNSVLTYGVYQIHDE